MFLFFLFFCLFVFIVKNYVGRDIKRMKHLSLSFVILSKSFLMWSYLFLFILSFHFRWLVAWMPIPAGTVRQYGCSSTARKSFRTWLPWWGSCWSSSTSPPASSPPESSTIGMASLRASSTRWSIYPGPHRINYNKQEKWLIFLMHLCCCRKLIELAEVAVKC